MKVKVSCEACSKNLRVEVEEIRTHLSCETPSKMRKLTLLLFFSSLALFSSVPSSRLLCSTLRLLYFALLSRHYSVTLTLCSSSLPSFFLITLLHSSMFFSPQFKSRLLHSPSPFPFSIPILRSPSPFPFSIPFHSPSLPFPALLGPTLP